MDMASTGSHIPCGSEADLDFIRKLLKPSNRSHSEPFTPYICTRFFTSLADAHEANGANGGNGACGCWHSFLMNTRGLTVECGDRG